MKQHTPHWHRSIHAIHFGLVGGLLVLSLLAGVFGPALTPVFLKQAGAAVSVFPAGSFWNNAVPSYTTLHPNSSGLANDIQRQVNQFGVGFAHDAGASPVYVPESGAPTVSVLPRDCGNGITPGLAEQWVAVPIPFYAVPSQDKQMIVRQPGGSAIWEFGGMQKVGNQWQACSGGQISSASDGVFASPFGVSTSGLAVLGGQLSIQELEEKSINHVIGLSLPQSNSSVWPASQSGGSVGGAPALGSRLRLDPAVSIDELPLNATGKAIARAAQTYGFVVWNNAPTVRVTGENPISRTTRGLPSPYASIGNPLNGFPWDKLQVLPTDYGAVADIPAITSFTTSKSAIRADNTINLSWSASNVNHCILPGYADSLPSSGTFTSPRLRSDTVFTLRCGGPSGAASSQLSVRVYAIAANDPLPELEPAVIIDQPYSGYANVFPELMSPEQAAEVYRVVYYKSEAFIAETATPPFALNTQRLDNGAHTITARMYYRGGAVEEKAIGISVNNTPETLFATTQSGVIVAPQSIPRAWALGGLVLVIIAMGVGSWWGFHRAHLMN